MDELQEHIPIELQDMPKRSRIGTLLVFLAVGIACALVLYLSSAPNNFPTKTFLKIRQGDTLGSVTDRAETLHLVRSSLLLKVAVKVFGKDTQLQTGDYYFDKPVSFWTVAEYLATGDFNVEPVKVILYEGINRRQMADRFAKDLPYFSKEDFLQKTENEEGFLFPDTYFIYPAADTDEVIALLRNAYERVVSPLRPEINASGMTEHDVITFASLVEREAAGDNDRAIIAGILSNRIKKGMRLQVDAPFLYEYNITQGELTPELIKTDSLYNTYTRSGLTPGPIGSPSKSSIVAVLRPAKTDYLFYLHDRTGVVHYAKTFEEHKRNIARYLVR